MEFPLSEGGLLTDTRVWLLESNMAGGKSLSPKMRLLCSQLLAV